jgi:dihydrofolate reductase
MPRSIKLSVFCGISVDGFLARTDHKVDFLRTHEQEPHGFEEFYNSIDVVVIGRNTYQFVVSYGEWLYGKKPVVVLSSRLIDFSWIKTGVVEQMSGEPTGIVAELEARGYGHAYIDGGVTIQRFLAAGLIDRMIISYVPVLIGSGMPLFGALPHDIKLLHVATRTYRGGLVQSEYEIAGSPKLEKKQQKEKRTINSGKSPFSK